MMATELLDQILGHLRQARLQCPDLRFGQLIAIIGELAADETGHSLWDVEDDDFARALDRFVDDMARRASDRGEPAAAPARGGITSSLESTPPQPPRQVS